MSAFLNFGFVKKANPLFDELEERVVSYGQSTNEWDNIHQTNLGMIDEPGISPGIYPEWHLIGGGCPECAHSHWRWGAFMGPEFGSGNIIGFPAGSLQDLEFAVVKYNVGQDRPTDYKTLVNGEHIRHPATGFDPREQLYDYTAPDEVVSWYSGTGRQNGDTFFGYGSFFCSSIKDHHLHQAGDSATQSEFTAENVSSSDSLSSIVVADLYEDGPTTISPFDSTILGPLPAGYTVYNNLSYHIQTDAAVSGPHVVSFNVPSVTDQTFFNNLRIFHAEQDQFEPAKVIWVDRTILAPEAMAPDFANKQVNAKTTLLGQFVLAMLTTPQPPITGSADLVVSSSHSPFQIVAGSNLNYTFTVGNNGAQMATGVAFANPLPPNSRFVSVAPTQGACSEINGTVVCKLGSINSGASVAVTVVATITEGGRQFGPTGNVVTSTAYARSDQADPNVTNNMVSEYVTVLPDPNLAPTVEITSPKSGDIFVGPQNVTIVAKASDSDGIISSVDFYEDGQLLGTGTPNGSNQFSITWANAPLGEHSIIAIATDDGGKRDISAAANIMVNGFGTVRITSPTTWTAFQSPANITLNIDAYGDEGATLSRVDLYANGSPIGTANFLGGYQYRFVWNNVSSGTYAITAVGIEANGIATRSVSVPIDVYLKFNLAPTVTFTSPVNGAPYPAPADVIMTANATDTDGTISSVNFYANGTLVGGGTLTGTNQYSFTWTNVPRGNYLLTAVAIDNDGSTSVSTANNIKVGAPALFVVGSTTLNNGDAAVKTRLEALGYFVVVKSATTATSADATGKAVVLVSSTVAPSAVGTKFRTVTVPVITWEAGLFANMGMTGTTTKDNGTVTKQTQIKITNAGHPLAAGLSSTVTVVTVSGTFTWGKPNANAASIATAAADATKPLIFGYPSGVSMPGLTAPAARVGLFMYDTTAASFNTNGSALFDAAISWATGLPPLP